MYIAWHFINISLKNFLLASQGFGYWKNDMGKSRGTFHRHEQSERHKESVEKANVLMLNTENNKSIEEKLN